MDYSFKKHKLSDAERMWLIETSNSEKFDPKVAKVKLWGAIPEDFEPNQIDRRIYKNRQPTLIGLWLVDPKNPIFKVIDRVIFSIRERITSNPGIAQITSQEIAQDEGLEEDLVGKALYQLGQLGDFYNSASGGTGENKFVSLSYSSDNAYDEYLRFRGIEELLERVYLREEATQRMPSNNLWPTLMTTTATIGDFGGFAESVIETKAIKVNTAFVLMAMDRSRPELEDIYNAIKETCKEFGINAYRADEIQHQDRITDRILQEIRACEYLIADLSLERPNVYYEVGYAHAVNKKPILFRRAETKLHFDLSVHNVPEYKNATELRDLLRRRLEAILGRKPKDPE